MNSRLINILLIILFVFCRSLLNAQDFRGGDIRCTYIVSPLEVNININLYFYTEEEPGLDTIVMRTEGVDYTLVADEIIPINRGISIYRYNQEVLYIGLEGRPINVLSTPSVEVDHQALIEDSIGISLSTYFSNGISSNPPFDTTFATWDDFLFDYAIDEAGDLIFQLSGTDPDGDGSVAFSFSNQLDFWYDQGWYEYPAPLADLQLNPYTGAFRWRNPPGPGKYMLGFDLHSLFPNSTVLNNMFTRYLVIELTEDDFITATGEVLAAPQALLYPNPSTGNSYLRLPTESGPVQVQVYNAQGQQCYSERQEVAAGGDLSIPSATWPGGVYFVHVQFEQGDWTGKLVVE
ncbi:MAG: T9SS type A sorting domain-containing protein [Bacteroidota bacterium]